MTRYAVLPAGSDHNQPRLTEAALADLIRRHRGAPINPPYRSAVLAARTDRRGGTR